MERLTRGRTESRAGEVELLFDQPRVGENIRAVNLDTLDGRDSSGLGVENSRLAELSQDLNREEGVVKRMVEDVHRENPLTGGKN